MFHDPIVEELRKIRYEHAKRFDFTLKRILDDLKAQEGASGRTYLRLPPRRVTKEDRAPERVGAFR